jgi:hypothetical protein
MTLKRKNAIIRKVKDITVGSTLMFALLSGSVVLQSCDGGEEGTEQVHTKSVQTYIQETEPNKFQITHEEVGIDDQVSQAYINFLNGTTKVLTLDEAQQLLAQQAPDTTVSVAQNQIDTTTATTAVGKPTTSANGNASTAYNDTNSGQHYQNHSGGGSLSTILYYSALGNMLGRHHYSYAPSYFYHSPESYNRSFNTNTTLRNSVSSRPRSSSSGFFGSSSRSRSSGG